MANYNDRAVKNLRKMIDESGMSADQVALGAQIPEEAVARCLSGKQAPTVLMLEKLTEFLDKDFTALFK